MDQLRAERARFESELAAGGSPGVIPETPLGEGGHVPTAAVETTRIDDAPGRNDDSVWDSDWTRCGLGVDSLRTRCGLAVGSLLWARC